MFGTLLAGLGRPLFPHLSRLMSRVLQLQKMAVDHRHYALAHIFQIRSYHHSHSEYFDFLLLRSLSAPNIA